MDILLNKLDKEKLDNLIETKEINLVVNDMFSTCFFYPTIINRKELERLTKEECLTEKDAIIQMILEFLEIDTESEENQEIVDVYFDNIHPLNYKKYESNPYVINVKPKENKVGKYEIKYMKYLPYQLLPADELTVKGEYFSEICDIGYFKKEYKYLAILENDTVWMSLNPNEINTMENDIKAATGRVLTFGLGLGYFQYMCSLKDDVKEVTIIEKDPNIISLFKKHLLPYFKNKDKIKIISKDAYDFLKNDFKDDYDYIFVDIHHDPNDGTINYLKFKEYEKNTKFHYWLEPSLKQNIRRAIITIVQEYFEGYTADNYQKSETNFDKLVNYLYSKIKDENIYTYESLIKIIDQFM